VKQQKFQKVYDIKKIKNENTGRKWYINQFIAFELFPMQIV
jgi:hypothetical protein